MCFFPSDRNRKENKVSVFHVGIYMFEVLCFSVSNLVLFSCLTKIEHALFFWLFYGLRFEEDIWWDPVASIFAQA